MTEPEGNDLQQLWQTQPTEISAMSLEVIRSRAKAFQSRLFRRNLREYIFAAISIALTGSLGVWYPDMIMRAGFVLILLGTLFYVYVLHSRGYADLKTLSTLSDNCLTFHKAALTRNRDLYRTLWLWGIVPVMPGFGIIFWRIAHLAPTEFIRLYAGAAVALCLTVVIIAYSRFRAAQMDAEIESLANQN